MDRGLNLTSSSRYQDFNSKRNFWTFVFICQLATLSQSLIFKLHVDWFHSSRSKAAHDEVLAPLLLCHEDSSVHACFKFTMVQLWRNPHKNLKHVAPDQEEHARTLIAVHRTTKQCKQFPHKQWDVDDMSQKIKDKTAVLLVLCRSDICQKRSSFWRVGGGSWTQMTQNHSLFFVDFTAECDVNFWAFVKLF